MKALGIFGLGKRRIKGLKIMLCVKKKEIRLQLKKKKKKEKTFGFGNPGSYSEIRSNEGK